MIQVFETIVYGTSESDFETYNDGRTADDKTNAMAHLKAVSLFMHLLTTLQRSCTLGKLQLSFKDYIKTLLLVLH